MKEIRNIDLLRINKHTPLFLMILAMTGIDPELTEVFGFQLTWAFLVIGASILFKDFLSTLR